MHTPGPWGNMAVLELKIVEERIKNGATVELLQVGGGGRERGECVSHTHEYKQ